MSVPTIVETWCYGSGKSPDWMEIMDGEAHGPCPQCRAILVLDRFGMTPDHAHADDVEDGE